MISKTKLFSIFSFWFEILYIPDSLSAQDICSNEKVRNLGYVKVKEIDKCLLFSVTDLNWYKASQSCLLLGGQLYTAHHVSQLLKEFHIPYNFRHEDFWVGLNDIEKEGDFKWNLGSDGDQNLGVPSVELFPWQQGQPDNGGDNEDCVLKARDGTWRDEACNKKFRYICETTKSMKDLESSALSSEDHPDEQPSRQNWIFIVLGLFCFMFVIPVTVHLFTRARLDKQQGRSAEEAVEGDSFTSAISTDSDLSSTLTTTKGSSSAATTSASHTSTTLRSATSQTLSDLTSATKSDTETESAGRPVKQKKNRTVVFARNSRPY